jgi:hypothetical protein
MVNITRLKHQERRFTRIDAWAIEREGFCRTHKWDVGFYIVKGSCFIAKVLPLEEYDGEMGRQLFRAPLEALGCVRSPSRRGTQDRAASRSSQVVRRVSLA